MTIHIFTGESFYSKAFLDFYNNNFSATDTIFVFRSRSKNNFSYGQNIKDKILFVENFIEFFTVLLPKLFKANKIFMHYYPVGPSLFIWYPLSNFLFHKTTWILWGGDVYYFKDKGTGLLPALYEFIRRRTIKKFRTIACFIKGDYEIARKIYKANAEYKYVCYPIPVDFNFLESVIKDRNSKKSNTKIILLGNSATSSNNHIEALDIIKKFREEDIKIICPLSYPPLNDYSNNVMEYGKSVFGDKFIPLTKMMGVEDYGKLLDTVDIAVMNHRRQQGLGNILSLLYLGKKVYLRNDITSIDFFREKNICVYDIEQISKLSLKEFYLIEENIKESNYHIIKEEFSGENYKRMWGNVLEH